MSETHEALQAENANPVPAVCGIDLGSVHSKCALAYWSGDKPHLMRVQFEGKLDDPDRPEDANSQFEFVACGAVDEQTGEEVEGRHALSYDSAIWLKTMLVFLALAAGRRRDQIMSKLPWGDVLLSAVREKRIACVTMRNLISMHLRRLHHAIMATAKRRALEIMTVVLTYPNYLIPNEGSRDFDNYIELLLGLLLPIWGPVKHRIMSEGQASAMHLCIPFYDVTRGMFRQYLDEIFRDLNKRKWVNLVVADIGSSSLNIQTVCVWFDEEGNVMHSQTFARPGQMAGAQSGSHLANDEVRKILDEKLAEAQAEHGVEIRPGDKAKYLQSFDRKKRAADFDYGKNIREETVLRLQIENSTQFWVDLDHVQQKHIFGTAFNRGYRMIRKYLPPDVLVRDGVDTAIVFGGGSCIGRGTRADLEALVEMYEEPADQAGITVNYGFMGNLDPMYWSTAVCGGAALAILTQPRLVDILPGFTIGLQVVEVQGVARVGEDAAQVLFSQGCGAASRQRMRQGLLYNNTRKMAQSYRFNLVADPSYHQGRPAGDKYRKRLPPIQIRPGRTVGGNPNPLSPYDLGCELDAADLPRGRIHFSLGGSGLDALSSDTSHASIQDEDSFLVILSCLAVDDQGHNKLDDKDKKFVLRVQADGASRFPIISQEEDFTKSALPVQCSQCREYMLGQRATACRECTYNICGQCSEEPRWPAAHKKDHHVGPLQVDV